MQFKVDENLPSKVANMLNDSGHDALTIHDQHTVGDPDPRLAVVRQGQEQALITLDVNFSDIRTHLPGGMTASSCFAALSR